MLKLRKFMCGCFGLLALLFAFISASTIPMLLFRIRQSRLTPPIHSALPAMPLPPFVYSLLAKFVLVMPLPLAVLYCMAWWTIRKGKPSARVWAIAASSAMILQGIPVFVATGNAWLYGSHEQAMRFFLINAPLLALGVAGIIAFVHRDAVSQSPLVPIKPARIAGDGTSSLLDATAWIAAVAGYCVGQFLLVRWGRAEHLPFTGGLLYWPLLGAAALFEAAAHEAGHATVGVALGMKLRVFIVGPFQWRIRDGRWRFQFLITKFLSLGGAAGVIPTKPDQSRKDEIYMIAAGPLASLFTGLIGLAVVLTAKGAPYERAWEFFALVATLGFVSFAVNLIPVRPDSLYSDGARIYHLLSGGPWADYHRATSMAAAGLVTALRPRDYDLPAIQRASKGITSGQQGLLLRLFAYNYFHDRGRIPEACSALSEAEAIYHQSASNVPAEWHALFVFGNAYLKRDAIAARQWWDRMQALKPAGRDAVYWLAQSALYWIEDDPAGADEAWRKGNDLAQKLPAAGAYDFNRDCFSHLRHTLDEVPMAK
jgi:hypothetical protein